MKLQRKRKEEKRKKEKDSETAEDKKRLFFCILHRAPTVSFCPGSLKLCSWP